MFAESSDDEQIIERVAALDIGKAEIVCCVRLPAADGETQGAGGVHALDDGRVRCVSWRTGWSGSGSSGW